MAALSQFQRSFIEDFSIKLKPREMAAYLNISAEKVRAFMKENALSSICKIKRVKDLEEDQKIFIRSNCQKLSISEMSRQLNVDYYKVYKLLKTEKLNYNQHQKTPILIIMEQLTPVFSVIKANIFFSMYCQDVKNWVHKMRGKDGRNNPIEFSRSDLIFIEKGIEKMTAQLKRIVSAKISIK